jgi:23S rRNA (cytidine1920-2'-O)/16S rRNA (cytidine1409-2'-O)-methyltransferase
VVRDAFNVRHLKPEDLPEDISFVSVDLSFISLTKILLPLKHSLVLPDLPYRIEGAEPVADIVLLVKPQFEVGKGEVGKGGIVRDPAQRARVVEAIETFACDNGFLVLGSMRSPVVGSGGNQEFLLYLKLLKGLLSVS